MDRALARLLSRVESGEAILAPGKAWVIVTAADELPDV
jgi:hypothetical protein